MQFLISLGVAILGVVLFVLGVFYWHSIIWAAIGFGLGLVGMVALRSQSS
jgi:hypothetical protein